MNKLIPAGLLLLLIAAGIGLSFFVPRLLDSQQPVLEKEVWVYAGHPVSQTIVPKNNGLSLIRIYMRNVALWNQDPLEFTLTDAVSGQVIRQIHLNGFNIGDREVIRLQFEPIPDSAGRNFIIKFTSPTSDIGRSLGIGYTSEDHYPAGSENSYESQPGDLTFELYYQPTNRIQAVFGVFLNFIRRLLTLRIVVTFIFSYLFLSGLLGLIIPSRLFSPRRNPGDR